MPACYNFTGIKLGLICKVCIYKMRKWQWLWQWPLSFYLEYTQLNHTSSNCSNTPRWHQSWHPSPRWDHTSDPCFLALQENEDRNDHAAMQYKKKLDNLWILVTITWGRWGYHIIPSVGWVSVINGNFPYQRSNTSCVEMAKHSYSDSMVMAAQICTEW